MMRLARGDDVFHYSLIMKAKGLIAVLFLAVVALAVWSVLQNRKAASLRTEHAQQIDYLSNELNRVKAEANQAGQEQVRLKRNLEEVAARLKEATNQLVTTQAKLQEVQTAAQEAARLAEQEISKREERIGELEGLNKQLQAQVKSMEGMIRDLDSRIAETQKQLASAKGERQFLLRELKRLQTEKAELERQFSDLSVLQARVRRLRQLQGAEALMAMRQRLTGAGRPLKGAELLARGFQTRQPAKKGTNVLEAEIHRSGETSVNRP